MLFGNQYDSKRDCHGTDLDFCGNDGEHEKKKKREKRRDGIPLSYPVTYALSPCCARSRPISSSFGVTLMPPGHTISIILIMAAVMPMHHASAANAPTAFSYSCAGLPKARPLSPHGVNLFSAKVPVSKAPARPPMPCTPHVSSASSHFLLFLNATAA